MAHSIFSWLVRSMIKATGWTAALALAMVSVTSCPSPASAQGTRLVPGRPAPEIDQGTDWLGVKDPLQLKDLRGKFVLLDFWTLC